MNYLKLQGFSPQFLLKNNQSSESNTQLSIFQHKNNVERSIICKSNWQGKKKHIVDRNIYSMLQKLKCNRNVNDLRGKHKLNGEGSVMLHPEKIRMQAVCIYIYIYCSF